MTMWILNKMQLHRQRETFYVFEFDLLLFFFSLCALWGWLSCWNPQNSHICSGLFFFFPENGYCRGKKSSSLKDVAMVSLILYLHTVWEVSILNKLQTLLDGEMFTFHIVQPLSRRAWLLFIEVNQTAP